MPELEDPKKELLAQAYAIGGSSQRARSLLGGGSMPNGAIVERINSDPAVKARVQEIVRTRFDLAGITANRVMTELARVAFASAKDVFDSNGELIPIHEMSDDAAATIAGIDVEVHWVGKGDDRTPVTLKKIKRVPKMDALNTLAKHFKIVGDEGDGVNALASALADRLKAARTRVVPKDVEDAQEVRPRRVISAPEEPQPEESGDDEDGQLW